MGCFFFLFRPSSITSVFSLCDQVRNYYEPTFVCFSTISYYVSTKHSFHLQMSKRKNSSTFFSWRFYLSFPHLGGSINPFTQVVKLFSNSLLRKPVLWFFRLVDMAFATKANHYFDMSGGFTMVSTLHLLLKAIWNFSR